MRKFFSRKNQHATGNWFEAIPFTILEKIYIIFQNDTNSGCAKTHKS